MQYVQKNYEKLVDLLAEAWSDAEMINELRNPKARLSKIRLMLLRAIDEIDRPRGFVRKKELVHALRRSA